jgi:hypothetical protein
MSCALAYFVIGGREIIVIVVIQKTEENPQNPLCQIVDTVSHPNEEMVIDDWRLPMRL